MDKLEKDILDLADYLGCNAAELWHELKPMFEHESLKARLIELDLLEQGINMKLDMHLYKLDRLADLVMKLDAIKSPNPKEGTDI